MHVHDLQPFKMAYFNMTHRINRISFGKEFPGIINPLDGAEKISSLFMPPIHSLTLFSLSLNRLCFATGEEGSTMHQYFVKIVPTIYESLDGSVINTNQFSVTEYTRQMPPNDKSGLPGMSSAEALYVISRR